MTDDVNNAANHTGDPVQTGGDPHGSGTWTRWTLNGGQWSWSQEPGSAPTTGGHMESGLRNGRTERHMVYGDASGGTQTSSSSPTHRTRPPYYHRERYFDATTGKWRHRWRYRATNAEVEARRAGLHHDSRGYYRVVNGRRTYVTGHTASGRRFHTANGQRVWDDPAHWPSYFNHRRHELRKRREELKSRLDSLREQYRRARGHNHVLAHNIVRRMHSVERNLGTVTQELRALPSRTLPALKLRGQNRFHGGISVILDYSLPPSDGVNLSFGTGARVPKNTIIYLRATITLYDRDWHPGLLSHSTTMRVLWQAPAGWLIEDAIKGEISHEWLVSNPLRLVRAYRSPSLESGTPAFKVSAALYEFTFAGGRSDVPVEGSH